MRAIFLAFAMFLLVAMASAGYKGGCTSSCGGFCSYRCSSVQISQPNCACARYGGLCCINRFPHHPRPVPVYVPAPAPAPGAAAAPAPAPLPPSPYPHAKSPYWRPPHKG